VVVVAALAIVGTACGGSSSAGSSGGGSSAPAGTITPKPGSTVDAKVGRPFVVKLVSNNTAGYAWSVKQTPPNIQFTKSEYLDPKSQRLGDSGTQLLTFDPTAAGTGPIDLIYDLTASPTTPARTLTFTVRATK
jgi:predicted secreted protein